MPGVWKLTPLSARQVLAVVGKQHLSAGWQELEWGIRTKGRIFEKAYGEAFFERCANDMSIEDTYSKGMSALDHTCKLSQSFVFPFLILEPRM